MSYSEDLRNRVRSYVLSGGKKSEASRIFKVSPSAIRCWLADDRPARKPGRTKPDKVDEAILLEDVRQYPDKRLVDRAKLFDMSISGMSDALKRLGIVKKKPKIRGK